MTLTRLTIILSIGMVAVDLKFNNGRFVETLWNQMRQLGYWLNYDFSSLTHKIAPFS